MCVSEREEGERERREREDKEIQSQKYTLFWEKTKEYSLCKKYILFFFEKITACF